MNTFLHKFEDKIKGVLEGSKVVRHDLLPARSIQARFPTHESKLQTVKLPD
jgi:hypothetical protein